MESASCEKMNFHPHLGKLNRKDTNSKGGKKELTNNLTSCDTKQPPSNCSQVLPHLYTQGLKTSVCAVTSNPSSNASSAPSFVCSVDLVDSDNSPVEEVTTIDEFAQFVKASIHPPNELSVPRCYPEPFLTKKQAVLNRSKTVCSSHPDQLRPSSSIPSSPRPRLRRESAQEIDDEDISCISSDRQSLVSSSQYSSLSVSPQLSRSPSPMEFKSHLTFQNKSAPGSPGTKRISSQVSTDGSGHLRVPLSKMRGSSLPETMDESTESNKVYLMKQFNIQGRKVIHMGDSFQQREQRIRSFGNYLSPR